ncbi:MAG: hypothetical protein KDD06_23640, partial [Phaeodactylibacter sp.]|nr:hypothetical protein [Phaeodactylibacter sp.]
MTRRKKFYQKIKEGPVTERATPAGIRDSTEFQQLLAGGIVCREKRGRGYVYRVAMPPAFESFWQANFPLDTQEDGPPDGAANVARFRDSKAQKRPGKRIFLLRGWQDVIVNDTPLNLKEHTTNFGFFAASVLKAGIPKVCSVENLEVFMAAETVLDSSWVFLHPYGR